jgi:hypothetical protein
MMKRLLIALAACLVVAGMAQAQTASGWADAPRATSGRLISTVSTTITLTTLQADADSSITIATPLDLTGTDRLPGAVLVYIAATGAAGGGTTTHLDFLFYGHGASTSTTGLNAAIANNVLASTLSGAPAITAQPLTMNAVAAPSGLLQLLPSNGGVSGARACLPRYLSFNYAKHGDGKFTAGTVTVTFYTYAQ